MNGDSGLDKFLFTALTLAIIFGGIIAFLFMLSMQEKVTYSAVYLKPNSYTNFLANGSVQFTYGIRNMEEEDIDYLVRFVAGNNVIKTENVFVKKGTSVEEEEILKLEELPRFPFKMRVILSTGKEKEKSSEAFFWVKD